MRFQQTTRAGLSLMEMILALGIMSIVGGTVVPLAMDQIESSRVTAAEKDVRAIRSAVSNFFVDVQQYPARQAAGTPTDHFFRYIITAGQPVTYTDTGYYTSTTRDSLSFHLIENNNLRYTAWNNQLRIGWRGPYLDEDVVDPWGNRYSVSFAPWTLNDPTRPAWVISAGRTMNVETLNNDIALANDDVGVRL